MIMLRLDGSGRPPKEIENPSIKKSDRFDFSFFGPDAVGR
jgi:hypothetical protein